ncbi:MAG: hypothetical protein A3K13_10240 [Gemmatimonadetes bacterium RIFCSPLOWO2_12_FULL_68_9]|nr:MAG: hypothetical protein A3K13_10240 [Gemmatimonadetes bacterium RIFCSPLOWO2_12_FULL_68_9]
MTDRNESVVGIALAAAAGFGVGLLAGLATGEWLGDVDTARVRRAVDRLRPGAAPPDAAGIERTVRNALEAEAGTRYLKARPRVLGEKLLELVGRVPSPAARERAAAVAQRAAPGFTVINRLLVEGQDVPRGSPKRGRVGDAGDR